jgi:F1F0 ATPase subunit 2
MTPDVLALLARALAGFAAGMLLGLIHFSSLWINVRLFTTGGAALALCVQLLRFALLLAVLVALAMAGAVALLFGGLGICVARRVVLRRVGSV